MSAVGQQVLGAIAALLRELGTGKVISARSTRWQSATFDGERVIAVCDFEGEAAWPGGSVFAAMITEDMLPIAGGEVIEVNVNWSHQSAQHFTCEIEVLALELQAA